MKKINKILPICLLAFSLVSCGNNTSSLNGSDAVTVTDLLGRNVTVKPKEINKIVCIGAGALRLYSYIGDLDKLSGVEDAEKKFIIALRPYQDINQEYFNTLDSCGVGGPQNQVAEPEKILNCNPDLVISLYTQSNEAMDQLSAQINAPVITLSYGSSEVFSDNINTSLEILGKVLGKEERAESLKSYIGTMKEELINYSAGVNKEDKETFYLACQSNYGTQGFQSSTSSYSLFDASNIRNVLDEDENYAGKGYSRTVDLEALLSMDPDKVVIDAGGLNNLKTEYETTEKGVAINALNAVKNHEVYIQLPFNAYYTNIETAYIDAYYLASLSYPTKMTGFNIEDKANEIYKTFLGEDNYYTNRVKSYYKGGFQKINTNLETWIKENV